VVEIDVLANDSDADSLIDRSSVRVQTGPDNGRVLMIDPATGRITYLPGIGFSGTDQFTYTVDDEQGVVSNAATVTIEVYEVNDFPVAHAGPDQNAETEALVTLDGSQSYDPDGDLITYDWKLNSKPADSGLDDGSINGRASPNPTFVPDVDGLYVFWLTVDDGELVSLADDVEITATTPNVPPNAEAGDDQTAYLGDAVLLDGGGSSDPDFGPSPLSYFWTFEDLPAASQLVDSAIADDTESQASFIPDVVGTYELNLSVFDGLTDDDDVVTITVSEQIVPPNALAGEDQHAMLGDDVELDGSASYDPDAGPEALVFTWRFVSVPDGSGLTNADIYEADGPTPFITPDVAGAYVLELEVFDGVAYDFDEVVITVEASALALKGQALIALEKLEGSNRHSRKELKKAISHLEKAVEPKLWIDPAHVDVKHGHKVFDEEMKTVKHLMKILKKGKKYNDPAVSFEVTGIIEGLVQADRLLAGAVIDEVRDGIENDRPKHKKVDEKLAKAVKEYGKAWKYRGDGKYDKSIDHYKKAWKYAQEALRKLLDHGAKDDHGDKDDDSDSDSNGKHRDKGKGKKDEKEDEDDREENGD
jgi:hypothetical protein